MASRLSHVIGLSVAYVLPMIAPNWAVAACVPAPSGLVAWWPGDGNFKDIVGGNDATSQGGVTFSSGEVANAVLFDGASEWLVVGNPPALDLTGDFTIAAWVKRTGQIGPRGNHIVSRRSVSCGQEAYQLGINADALLEANGGAAKVTSGLWVPADTWVFVAVAYHSGANPTIDFHVDNQHELGVPSNAPVGNVISPQLWIAQAQGCFPEDLWRGAIDELQIYDRALSAIELATIFDAGQDGVCKSSTVVPAVSEWGLVTMGLLGVSVGAVLFRTKHRRQMA